MKINTSILALTLALLPGMATAGRKWLNKKLWDANGQSAGSVSIVKGGQGSINTDTGPITAEGSYDIYERNGKIEGGLPGYKYTEDRYEDRKDDRYYNTHGITSAMDQPNMEIMEVGIGAMDTMVLQGSLYRPANTNSE